MFRNAVFVLFAALSRCRTPYIRQMRKSVFLEAVGMYDDV